MAQQAHIQLPKLQLSLQRISNKRKSNKKPLTMTETIDVVSAFDLVYNCKQQAVIQSLCQLLDLLQEVLKCTTHQSNCTETQSNVKQAIQLFWEFITILAKSQVHNSKKIEVKLKTMHLDIQRFAVEIIHYHLSTMRSDKIFYILEDLHKTLSLLNKYSWIPILILQVLHKEHTKFEQILVKYSYNFLTLNTMLQFEQCINQLWSICGNPEYYLAPRLLKQLLLRYIEQFESTYRRDKKYVNHHWDPKIISSLLRKALILKSQISFTMLQEYSEDMDTSNRCNYCEQIVQNSESKIYLLSISNNVYTIKACRPCINSLSSISNLQIILIYVLALNSSDKDKASYSKSLQMVEQLGLSMKADQPVTYCECNKQLKLYENQFTKFVVMQAIFGNLIDKLWAMLMILSNCDDNSTRGKAVRMIGQLFEDCECLNDSDSNKNLILRIQKCLINRLYDTEPKIKQNSLIILLSITPLCSVSLKSLIHPIESEYIAPVMSSNMKGTNSNNLMKFLQEVIEKLCTVIKNKKVSQLWKQNIQQFKYWIILVGQVAAAYDHLKQNSNSKHSKINQTVSAGISMLAKHKKVVREYVKHYKSNPQLYCQFLQKIFRQGTSSQLSKCQKCYDSIIKVLVTVCGIDFLHQDECIEVVSHLFQNVVNSTANNEPLWINNSYVVRLILNANESKLLLRLIKDITYSCKALDMDQKEQIIDNCIRKCKILSAMLESVIESSEDVSVHKLKLQLQNLRELLISELLPESSVAISEKLPMNITQLSNSDQIVKPVVSGLEQMNNLESSTKTVCRLIADIDIVVGDCSFTISIYQNCWKIVQSLANQSLTDAISCQPDRHKNDQSQSKINEVVQKIKVIIQTARMMFTMLPELMRSIRANYQHNSKLKLETRINQLYGCMKLILYYLCSLNSPKFLLKQHFILHACQVLSNSHILSSNLLCSSEDLFSLLIDCPLPLQIKTIQIGLLLSSLYKVLIQCESVSLLEKSRDISMLVLTRAQDNHHHFLLNCKWTYGIAKLIVQKGLASWSSFNKIVVFGLIQSDIIFSESHKQIQTICSHILLSSAQDPLESRQLLSNFGQSLKLIISYFNPSANHQLYFATSQLCCPIPHSSLLSKHQQSQICLRPSLFKAMADHMNKMILSGKFLTTSTESIVQIRIICNTINMCSKIGVLDWKTLTRALMAILEMMYWEITRSFAYDDKKDNGAALNMWNVMVSLSYLLARNPYQQVTAQVQSYFLIQDQILCLPNTQNKLVFGEEGSFQQLYDVILHGAESDSTLSQSSTQQTAQSKALISNQSQISEKTKIKLHQKHIKNGKNAKRTKKVSHKEKAKVRNKSAPKQMQLDQESYFCKPSLQNDKQIVEYKKKLRNKSKIILT